jgi:hypothetical protein
MADPTATGKARDTGATSIERSIGVTSPRSLPVRLVLIASVLVVPFARRAVARG